MGDFATIMRSPSAKVLEDRCNIYLVSGPGRDSDGGVTFPYPSIPTLANVPCTTQPVSTAEVEGQSRITMMTQWRIMFGAFVPVSPKDQITFLDGGGVLRTVIVDAERDEAGRGAAFSIYATERI